MTLLRYVYLRRAKEAFKRAHPSGLLRGPRDEPGCGEGLPKGLVPSDGRVEASLLETVGEPGERPAPKVINPDPGPIRRGRRDLRLLRPSTTARASVGLYI